MKRQTRSFVVEIKSARRRSKTQPKAIWGDTDFKALLQAANADAPSLPASEPVRGKIEQADEPAITPFAVMEPHAEAIRDPVELAKAPSPETREAHRSSSETEAVPVERPDGKRLGSTTTKKTKRPQQPARGHDRGGANRRVNSIETHLRLGYRKAVDDDVIVLEDENRRLKNLLKEQLRQQNAALRKMLERFLVK